MITHGALLMKWGVTENQIGRAVVKIGQSISHLECGGMIGPKCSDEILLGRGHGHVRLIDKVNGGLGGSLRGDDAHHTVSATEVDNVLGLVKLGKLGNMLQKEAGADVETLSGEEVGVVAEPVFGSRKSVV